MHNGHFEFVINSRVSHLGTGQEEHRCRDTSDNCARQPKGRGEGVEGNLDLVAVAAGESG
jgi:hypothetical protein